MGVVARFGEAPVARFATADADGVPHLVPVTFVATEETIHTPIDHKPKRTSRLKRLANIEANPAVTLLVDHYVDDWDGLWWIRADGKAVVLAPGSDEHAAAAAALGAKYPQYRQTPVTGPIIEVRGLTWSSWAAAGPDAFATR
jgi:PPOX class probable F420-dependent enzyme